MGKSPPTGEMTEKNLLKVAEIFFRDGDWVAQKRFYYDPGNKRRYYQVDCYSSKYKIVWEYEGPNHYNNVWKIKRDGERQFYFDDNDYRFLRWPYYCQLTKDMARYFFKERYTEELYSEAIQFVYGAQKEEQILAPGFHTTKNTPANYITAGTRRFFEELGSFPRSLRYQVAESPHLYISRVGDQYLAIGEDSVYQELLAETYPRKEVNLYYRASELKGS